MKPSTSASRFETGQRRQLIHRRTRDQFHVVGHVEYPLPRSLQVVKGARCLERAENQSPKIVLHSRAHGRDPHCRVFIQRGHDTFQNHAIPFRCAGPHNHPTQSLAGR